MGMVNVPEQIWLILCKRYWYTFRSKEVFCLYTIASPRRIDLSLKVWVISFRYARTVNATSTKGTLFFSFHDSKFKYCRRIFKCIRFKRVPLGLHVRRQSYVRVFSLINSTWTYYRFCVPL